MPGTAGWCFNEAEARAPRMRCRAVLRRVFLHFASMRPRRARLGCFAVIAIGSGQLEASMRPRRARLGCGQPAAGFPSCCGGFNEAEARAPRMLLTNAVVAVKASAGLQ